MKRKSAIDDASAVATGLSEDFLVWRIAQGDRHAFDVLYRRYLPRLTRFLDRTVSRSSLVEEIIDDTMLVVWQKAHAFDKRSKVSTWIFGIAHRQAMKAVRLLDEPVDCDFDRIPDDAWEPERAYMQRQLQDAMASALNVLSADQRAAVRLTYYHGFRYWEIAQTMACPVNTVKTRLFNARRHLKSALWRFTEPAGRLKH